MSRAERLLRLMQTLRRHRYPVRGAELAEDAGISLRTLYRDIAALQKQGAHIDGSPGVGYLLRPGFMLPPLMLTQEEIEALVLGSRWVLRNGDPDLHAAAANLLAKVDAVLPVELRRAMEASSLLVGPAREAPMRARELAVVRKAIRAESKSQDSLCGFGRWGDAAHGVAVCAGVFRPRADFGGVVRAAAGLSAFPHRPDSRVCASGGAVSAEPPNLIEGVADAARGPTFGGGAAGQAAHQGDSRVAGLFGDRDRSTAP